MQKPGISEKIINLFGESKWCGVGVMCAIAVFKGIFRPTFTMMDKKSDPETKKYAAIREGLTEVAALPLYATVPYLCDKLAGKIFKGHPHVKNIQTNATFLGLGAATLVVPAACNVMQPPVMAAIKRRDVAKKAKLAEANTQPLPTNTFKGSYGMKVGG